jgi:hypothetical protein
MISLRRLFLSSFGLAASLFAHAQSTVTITVQDAPRQTFQGIGVGLNGAILNNHASAAEVQQLIFDDLNTRFLRLWHRPANDGSVSADQRFLADYVSSGVIAAARSRGVTTLLMQHTELFAAPLAAKFADYAEFIRVLRDTHGVVIDAVGLQNEPGPSGWTPAATVSAVHAYRAELDARGLQSVKIVPIDAPNADGTWAQRIQAIKTDVSAWAKIGAYSSHSYTMGANTQWSAFGDDKDYWQTEAGWIGPAYSTVASRFLNDVNHRVSAWFWFIGAHAPDNNGDQNKHRLVVMNGNGSFSVNPTYHFLRQLSQTFPVGSVFRNATANKNFPNSAMLWTVPEKKPAYNLAAAVAPDGTWRIGLTNGTQDVGESYYTPAQDYDVTVVVRELAGTGDIPFHVVRTRENAALQLTATLEPSETITFRNGTGVVRVSSRELVTLAEVRILRYLGLNSAAEIAADGASHTNVAFTPGRAANAAAFNGDAFVDLPKITPGSGSGGVSFWMRAAPGANAANAMLYYGAPGATGDGFGANSELHLSLNSAGRVNFYIHGSSPGAPVNITGSPVVTDDQWHHVAASWIHGGTARLWVDGVLVGQAQHQAWAHGFAGIHRLGRPGWNSRKFTGQIDDLTLFDRPIDTPQVRAHREFLNFDGYSAGLITDVSGEPASSAAAVLGDGTALRLWGNTWKKLPFPYTITADTIVEFDFQSSAQGEIQGVGFSTTGAAESSRFYKVWGTEAFGRATPVGAYGPAVGNRVLYAFRPGLHFTGAVNHLVFGNDHDVASPGSESIFANLRIYERPAISTFVLEGESGARFGAFQVGADANSFGGAHVFTPDGGGAVDGNANYVEYTINVSTPGVYRFFGRVRVLDTNGNAYDDDSFILQVNDQPPVPFLFSATSNWTWAPVRRNNLTSVVHLERLEAGAHTIRVRERENGAALDRLIITNDLGYTP